MIPAVLSQPKTRRKTDCALLGLGTATATTVSQAQTLEFALTLAQCDSGQQAWMRRVFLNAGIDRRSTVLAAAEGDIEGLGKFFPPAKDDSNLGPSTSQRMQRYEIEAPPLACRAAGAALEDSQIDPGDITHLITASCTGFFSPGLDAALINSLNLAPETKRLHVGFMGCHAAFNALAAARDIAMAQPNAKVLVCCVELCSLHTRYGWDPSKLVANALFADGAAAAIVSGESGSGRGGWRLRDSASLLIPHSLDAMTWRIGDHGFEMTLSPGVPDIIRRQLGPWCKTWLAQHDLAISDIAGWAIHPGGPKILAAAADALGLPENSLRFSREILARNGNLSSATVLFILREMADQVCGPCVAIGLGPGLTAEGMLLAR